MPARAIPLRAALIGAGLSAVLAGCGSTAATSTAAAAPAGTSTPGGASTAAGGSGLSPTSTPLGQVLATSGGRVVYVLEKGGADVPCAGACAAVWPPVTAGGNQVTAGGHPVYTFKGDSSAGQTHGQGVHSFGGTWQAVSPTGTPVPLAAPAASSSSSGGGGYGGY